MPQDELTLLERATTSTHRLVHCVTSAGRYCAWALLVSVLLIGCGGGSPSGGGSPFPTGALAHDAEVLQGRNLFAANCASCHGVSGGGGSGPRFNDGRLLRHFSSIDAQVAFVERGRGAMPAFATTFTESQLRAVVRYEREVLSRP